MKPIDDPYLNDVFKDFPDTSKPINRMDEKALMGGAVLCGCITVGIFLGMFLIAMFDKIMK